MITLQSNIQGIKFLTLCWQDQIKIMDFIACHYDSFWWIGLLKEINHAQGDILVKFMHPHGPCTTFKWPAREDTMTRRMYQISEGDYTKVTSVYL